MTARVLVVDDEQQLRRVLTMLLEKHGYQVRQAEDGKTALAEFELFKPDVVLLDLMLPDMDGVAVCRELRRNHVTPIIVLSIVGDQQTKVAALDEGADDYITKPFAADELMARVRVALRRGATDRAQQPVIALGDLVIDLRQRSVALRGEPLHLSPTEYSLLKYLAMNTGRVLTHAMILREVWGAEYAQDTHVLRTCINQLRTKLEDSPTAPRFIKTDPGIGYRVLDPAES